MMVCFINQKMVIGCCDMMDVEGNEYNNFVFYPTCYALKMPLDRSSETRLWKYWAAKEMATDIYLNSHDGHYYQWHFYFSGKEFISKLAQLLKKEWFR